MQVKGKIYANCDIIIYFYILNHFIKYVHNLLTDHDLGAYGEVVAFI